MKVEVARAARADAALLGGLFELYLHDLSAFTDFHELGDDGAFFPNHLRSWIDHDSPLTAAFVVRVEHKPAGFALVGRAPYPLMGKHRDYRMCEFFVANAWRRRGVGRAAALALFGQLRGVWEVSELPNNTRAIAFWRSVIGEFTGGRYEEVTDRGDLVQVFRSA